MYTTKAQRRNSRLDIINFVLQAVILTEAISRTIVLMILRSVCTCNFNFTQQLDATSLAPKFI